MTIRRAPLNRTREHTTKRRRDTGPSAAVVALVRERASECCERCGNDWGTQLHHRRPRGAGGSKRESTNQAANCTWICGPCHAEIESRREWATVHGWLVSQHSDPALVPVLTRHGWVLLTGSGGIEATE
jgi:5-methylcytosine-specific restriction protein A